MILNGLTKSFVNNALKKMVEPVPGAIVHCSLFGFEHSGIYIGNGEIVELTRTGLIRATNPSGFVEGTTAVAIYIACDGLHPLGSTKIAQRAIEKIGTSRNYNVLIDNCHQFSSGCISGEFENPDNAFWMLESTITSSLNNGNPINWRAWSLAPGELSIVPSLHDTTSRNATSKIEPSTWLPSPKPITPDINENLQAKSLSEEQKSKYQAIRAPRFNDGIVEFILLSWHCDVGDSINHGDKIATMFLDGHYEAIEVKSTCSGIVMELCDKPEHISGDTIIYVNQEQT